jgi:hypothetical protein
LVLPARHGILRSEGVMTDFVIRVECYAGHRGEEEPRRFWIGEREVGVEEVLDRWLAPEHRYFKLRGDDGATYIVRHDSGHDRWELTLFEQDPGARHS